MYRWIYTQFINDDIFLNLILHFGSMFGEDNISYLSYGFHDRKSGYTEHKRILIGKERVHEVEEALVIYNTNVLSFRISSFSLNGSISAYCSDKVDSINLVETGNSPLDDGYWRIRVPFGVFSGTITINERILFLSAIIYQDEQWGICPLLLSIKEWTWAVVSERTRNIGFFSVLSRTGKAKRYKWQCSESDFISTLSTEYDYLFSSLLQKKESPVSIDNLPYSINYLKALRQRNQEVHGTHLFNYYRYLLMDYEINRITGVCELMSVN